MVWKTDPSGALQMWLRRLWCGDWVLLNCPLEILQGTPRAAGSRCESCVSFSRPHCASSCGNCGLDWGMEFSKTAWLVSGSDRAPS